MDGRYLRMIMLLFVFALPATASAMREPPPPDGGGGPTSADAQPIVQGTIEKLPNTSTNTPFQGKICFQSDRDTNWEIYVMNANGSSQTRLTNNSATDWTCRWSPDGKQIVFISMRDNAQGEIYVMNADGSQQTRLTNNTADEWYPYWSPDGSKIVFSSDVDGDHEIYVMNRDGSGVTQLTFNTAMDTVPSWSPDNSTIAFVSDRDAGAVEIYVMNPDGSGQTRLTNNTVTDLYPNWSPDSGWIVSYTGGEVWRMKNDGSEATPLTDTTGDNWAAVYSPDGAYLAFSSDRDINQEVYAMYADGSGQTNLTNNSANDRYPHWNAFSYWMHLPIVLKQ
jgi:Tol biopolymer transport system component